MRLLNPIDPKNAFSIELDQSSKFSLESPPENESMVSIIAVLQAKNAMWVFTKSSMGLTESRIIQC